MGIRDITEACGLQTGEKNTHQTPQTNISRFKWRRSFLLLTLKLRPVSLLLPFPHKPFEAFSTSRCSVTSFCRKNKGMQCERCVLLGVWKTGLQPDPLYYLHGILLPAFDPPENTVSTLLYLHPPIIFPLLFCLSLHLSFSGFSPSLVFDANNTVIFCTQHLFKNRAAANDCFHYRLICPLFSLLNPFTYKMSESSDKRPSDFPHFSR